MSNGLFQATKIPELRRRLLWTLFFLGVYRLGIFVPTPGVNAKALKEFFEGEAGVFGIFNAFSGGALEQFSVFALGIMPYITSSIIFSLLTKSIPYLEALSKEGEPGRRKINQYTRYGTILITIFQGYMIALWLESRPSGYTIVHDPGFAFKFLTVVTLAAGTAFIMWIGEKITEKGIGNGISLIIFAGIVIRMPRGVRTLFRNFQNGEISFPDLFLVLLFMLAVVMAIVFMETAQRRIPIHHAKRMVGRKMAMAQKQFLPLKINMAGVIPPIFAMSILMFPTTISQFLGSRFTWLSSVNTFFVPGGWAYNVCYVGLIVFFAFFYTAINSNPMDMADNIKRSGGFIPGLRPGKHTADYIDTILMRLTTAGGIYLAAICVVPMGFQQKAQLFFGGTGLLIVVGVALDTIVQIQTLLLRSNYADMVSGSEGGGMRRFRGRSA